MAHDHSLTPSTPVPARQPLCTKHTYQIAKGQRPEVFMSELQHSVQRWGFPQQLVQLTQYVWGCCLKKQKCTVYLSSWLRGRDSSVVRTLDSWLKGCGFESLQEWRENFLRVNFLCWLLFRYLFHPHVTAVALKRPWSFCQKCRWQVTAKHAYTLHMWLCMKWHGCMVYTEHAEMEAVSCGTSHASTVSTPLQWIFKNVL